MADSDSDYIASSGDEAPKSKSNKTGKRGKRAGREKPRERWEEIQRAWDLGLEDDNIESTISELLEAGKKRRLLKDETPLQRGIIRHLVLILDLSVAMAEKDLRPTRYLLSLRYACDFVREFFEQNPISQMAVVGMRDGIAIRISDMGGNPQTHVDAIQKLRLDDPDGSPSLQNALEMARGALFHTPSHGTREVVIIYGALWSADPGDIHTTIRSLVADKIRVAVVGLAAQVSICKELVRITNAGDTSSYTVALNEVHFREKLLEATTPPVTRTQKMSANGLLMMGFPSRIVERTASLCACHSQMNKGGYLCSRCGTKVCQLPCECPACGLTLILSTHLARSYHHLFPLKNWLEVSWTEARRSTHCFSCQSAFPPPPAAALKDTPDAERQPAKTGSSTSISSRYKCPDCGMHFCVDCDVFCHEILYNCPGCQSLGDEKPARTTRGKKRARELSEGGAGAPPPPPPPAPPEPEPMVID
ncbi:Ssl1-like-domain-containing protein [Sphaerosporella brunnea]|uniref:General transcription and DNA repair factor IIH n=1 Tax=Sphaerosporella brunnea TaxID=1250544 RepID=A0A5J5EIJ6_9PEZI|nr:Ssl1-like-domain-containing protein [Sphaerosporella brunnea]